MNTISRPASNPQPTRADAATGTATAAGPPGGLRAQSLAEGGAGAALLHIERAAQERQPWARAHTALASCSRGLLADEHAALYLGAPAVAFALHTAAAGTSRYAHALDCLDARIAALTHRRVGAAHARIDRAERPRVGEFDLFYGLTGLGVYLHARDRDPATLRAVLTYLVRLTLPLPDDERQLCGWWSDHPPGGITTVLPGGHANLGMAHGIAGPLALLSLTAAAGTTVDGQHDAITRICGVLDTHRRDGPTGPRWPQWLTLPDLDAAVRPDLALDPATAGGAVAARPSWCYGTPGIARAQQLAAAALGCPARAGMARRALVSCLADPARLDQLHGPGLCHGKAGLLHLAQRADHDPAADPAVDVALARYRDRLRDRLTTEHHGPAGEFLDGDVGVHLALLAADNGGIPACGWDACLLLG